MFFYGEFNELHFFAVSKTIISVFFIKLSFSHFILKGWERLVLTRHISVISLNETRSGVYGRAEGSRQTGNRRHHQE